MPEHTIAENLQRLVDARTDIANAITAKGGTVAQGDGLEDFASAIAGIPVGAEVYAITPSVAPQSSDVRCIHYDGKLYIFGHYTGSVGFVTLNFPVPLSEMGITTNVSGTGGFSTSSNTYIKTVNLTPESTSFVDKVQTSGTIYVSLILSPTT